MTENSTEDIVIKSNDKITKETVAAMIDSTLQNFGKEQDVKWKVQSKSFTSKIISRTAALLQQFQKNITSINTALANKHTEKD